MGWNYGTSKRFKGSRQTAQDDMGDNARKMATEKEISTTTKATGEKKPHKQIAAS